MLNATIIASSRSPINAHLWHIVFFVSWFPIFAMMVLFERIVTRARARRHRSGNNQNIGDSRAKFLAPARPNGSTWLQLMALASFGAALVHAAVIHEHFGQSALYGLFFLGASIVQLMFGILVLYKPNRRLIIAGVLGNALMVAFWLASRTLGVPIGPDNGSTEPFGFLDSLASMYEAALAIFGVLALRAGATVPTWRWSKWAPIVRFVAPICVVGTLAASVLSSRS